MIKPSSIFNHLHRPSISNGLFPFIGKKTNDKPEEQYDSLVEKITSDHTSLLIIFHPEKKTIERLHKNYGIHPIHLDDIISPLQRPKVDYEDNYIYFVVHLPEYDQLKQKIGFVEVDFILTHSDVLVFPPRQFKPLSDIISQLRKDKNLRKHWFNKGAGFLLYNIIDKLVDAIFPVVEELEKEVDEIDRQVFTDQAKTAIEKISFLRRNAIFFQTLIKPELNYFTVIKDKEHPLLNKEIKIYFTNISDHLTKIWDRLEDVRELIDNLSTTFETYFSFKTNETIKILTIFSVILMPLTLLSSIYGMNLTFLPLADHPFALMILSFFMIGMVISMVFVFKFKRWI